MLKTISLVVIALIALVLIYAATRPDSFRVERRTTIQASPDKIYPYLVNFHRWDAWSPYEKKDPSMKRTFGGSPEGKGATYAWEGNKDIGMGSMEITDTQAPSRVSLRLDFTKPFEAHNNVDFTLRPAGATATEVTWAMHGPNTFIGKIMQLFFSMDKMVGQDFEAGLASLKSAAEQ